MKFEKFIKKYGEFSDSAFGEGPRTTGIIEHLKREIVELEQNPLDQLEWVDIMFLSIDGIRRLGYTPEQIVDFMEEKFAINKSRTWSDVKDENIPITHKKSLYVSRSVTSASVDDIVKEYAFSPKNLHVTVCYSRAPVSWYSKEFVPQTNTINLEKIKTSLCIFDGGSIVLKFDHPELFDRNSEFLSNGASSDFPSYKSHITIGNISETYLSEVDLVSAIGREFYIDAVLGPEVFEELDED